MTLGPTTQVMHALEQLWTEIRRRHADVPEAILVLASGTMGQPTEIFGHFARARWHVGDGVDPRAEFFIGAEGLRRPATEILGTALHEAAHGLAATRDIVDVSDGRYHNRKFAELAGELGVTVRKMDRQGWSDTAVPDDTATAYAEQVAVLEAALTVWRHTETEAVQRILETPEPDDENSEPGEPPARARIDVGAVDGRGAHRGGGNYIAVGCGCPKPRRGRFARSVFDLGPVTCGVCDEPFTEVG
ncbi:hypothetical protein AB5J62_20625 [Amycolatopsis sp. cg5]|uniref:hypothetical protein n=1 Tax=Amycolatopsis sp. cg5 TaxID=3238802 RepID=UPI00352544AB